MFFQIKPRWTTAVYLVSYDRTQELGLTLLGRVPMPALYPHTSLVQYSSLSIIFIYSNIQVVSTLAFYASSTSVVQYSSTTVVQSRRVYSTIAE